MFVKIPNAVLAMELSPNALKVYCYLCSCANVEGYATVSANKIAQRCDIARETVRNAAIQLEKASLVQIHRRYKSNGTYRSNGYTLARPAGRWFALEVSEHIFPYQQAHLRHMLPLCPSAAVLATWAFGKEKGRY